MNVLALVSLMGSGLTGVFLLATFIGWDGFRRQRPGPRLPNALVVSHIVLASLGFLLWVVFAVTEARPFAVASVAVIAVVVALGLGMFTRWVARWRVVDRSGDEPTPEQQLPRSAVAVHGVFALTTLLLVVFAAVAT